MLMLLTMLLATHTAGTAVIPWDMVAFYGAGVVGANLALLLLWFGKAAADRAMTIGQCVARKLAGVVIGMCLSWVWIGGQWWILELFADDMPTRLTSLGPIHVDALSSIAVGFALQWFLVQPRIVSRYFEKRAATTKPPGPPLVR